MQLITRHTNLSLFQSSTDPLLIFAQASSLHLAFTESVRGNLIFYVHTNTNTQMQKHKICPSHIHPLNTSKRSLNIRPKLYKIQSHLQLFSATEHPAALHLGKRGASSLGFNRDGFRPTLQNLVDVFLTELGAFILFIHNGTIGTSSKQIFYFFFGELLDLSK